MAQHRETGDHPALARLAVAAAVAATLHMGATPATAAPAAGFGPLSGPAGCLVAPGKSVPETSTCGSGKGLAGPNAVAVSPDGANVYVASGHRGPSLQSSFGSVAILKRDPATGGVTETGCLSSDGTDGRDGASGACTTSPSLLGADGIAVSADGATVFVTSNLSGSVVAFARDAASGSLTRLGCFQYRPPLGGPCPPANVFFSASTVVASADNKALYVASPEYGTVSAFTTSLLSPSTAPSPGSAPGSSVASLFGVPLPSLANPCVGVNGLDGSCAVGVATQGLDDLALSPDGKQLYAAAPDSRAVDVFARGGSGAITQSGCLKTEPPPGLCIDSKLKDSPRRLAVSPDGRDVYAVDSSGAGGRVDVLSRDPATGALSDASCVDFLPPPPEKQEASEEEPEEEKQESAPASPCSHVAGLSSVSLLAVSGDGSAVYAFGSGTAAFFARDPATGKLTETSCAAAEDRRCASTPALRGNKEGVAVSPDGRQVYFADPSSNAVFVFTLGASVITTRTSATHAGTARVRVICPRALRRPCTGRVQLARVLARKAKHRRGGRHIRRVLAGRSARFTITPGHRATVAVELSGSARHLLSARGHLRLTAVIAADPLAGGSGSGRRLLLGMGRY
jgi:DNA-binding beta-propeller fold protein YncE